MPQYIWSDEEFEKRLDEIYSSSISAAVKQNRARRLQRELMGVPAQEVASAIGVDVSLLRRWERGDRHPSERQRDAWDVVLETADKACAEANAR